jgi:maltooligosyltrehalose trehalohydrolase
MTAFFLLMPGIPLLFQGQEFGASSPFLYFADHGLGLARDVREGRRRSLAQFPSLATSEMLAELADPGDIDTLRRSMLDLGERERHASIYALHRDLLELRRRDTVLGQRPCRIEGAVLADEAWMLRFFAQNGADRLLIVNLGRDLLLGPAPEPLLAPVEGQGWRLLWSSEAPVYGGSGGPAQNAAGDWLVSGQSAVILAPGSSVTAAEAKKVCRLRKADG